MNGVDEYTKDDLTDKVTNLERENRKLSRRKFFLRTYLRDQFNTMKVSYAYAYDL